MSIISFNFSTSGDKRWMLKYNQPLQIMPQTTKIPTDSIISSYPDCSKCIVRDSVIHTSYITRAFTDLYANGLLERFRYNIKQYLLLCKRLKYKRLLLHLPQTTKEMNHLGDGMVELIEMFSNKELVSLGNGSYITLVLEIPSFKSGFTMDVYDYFKQIVSNFFHRFELKNVELCFDTAHLFSNNMDCKDMIALFERKINGRPLIDYAKIIHFNGNQNKMGKSDKHIQMFSPENKMTHANLLIRYLRDKDKILITENTTSFSDYKHWQEYAKHYKVGLVDNNDHIAA